jgi:hypothetical protein
VGTIPIHHSADSAKRISITSSCLDMLLSWPMLPLEGKSIVYVDLL